MSEGHLAVMLRAAGKRCLVVGGGAVAHRKVEECLRAGLEVLVVSPSLAPPLRDLVRQGRIRWRQGEFEPRDVEGTFIVFAAATPAVNETVCKAARRAGVLVNVVDCPELSDFISPAVLQRGPVTVAVSTGGASPALAALIRDRIADVVGDEVGEWAEVLASFRRRVQERVGDAAARQDLLRRAAALDGATRIARGEREALLAMLDSWLRVADPGVRVDPCARGGGGTQGG
ncbi:MAG: bifunctional precorrin-2 dehydrogenase/sirohydrochlorin ferrochelatase [Bacillota bacterium]|nr:bifunctional precorrin-2 dehydrogenase/sirohydrochlorin ferrochelatase [Bacillota bacterium]